MMTFGVGTQNVLLLGYHFILRHTLVLLIFFYIILKYINILNFLVPI